MRVQGNNGSINYNNISDTNHDTGVNKNSAGNNVKEAGSGVVMNANLLNFGTETIEEKRRKAQQMALGIVAEAFDGDKKIDEDLDARRKHIADLTAENVAYGKELERIDEFRADVIENYGVTEDSAEHADLELLRKERETRRTDPFLNSFTDEEKERLAAIKTNGITDYQQDMLDLDARQKEFTSRIEENKKLIKEENSIITGIKIERLKSHEMVDAKKQGDKIMDAASDSIVGMIVEEAKENVDEKIEEDKENAEAVKEKAEEIQEKIDEAKAKRDAEREKLEEMYELESELDKVSTATQTENMADVKKSLEAVVGELKLTMQDLSGAVVDEVI